MSSVVASGVVVSSVIVMTADFAAAGLRGGHYGRRRSVTRNRTDVVAELAHRVGDFLAIGPPGRDHFQQAGRDVYG